MELEFLEKIQVELEFHELKYFTWYSSSKKKNYKSTFTITQCSKNRISKQEHFPNQFGKLGKMLDFLCEMGICPFWPNF